jgi:hypothetical protein
MDSRGEVDKGTQKEAEGIHGARGYHLAVVTYYTEVSLQLTIENPYFFLKEGCHGRTREAQIP